MILDCIAYRGCDHHAPRKIKLDDRRLFGGSPLAQNERHFAQFFEIRFWGIHTQFAFVCNRKSAPASTHTSFSPSSTTVTRGSGPRVRDLTRARTNAPTSVGTSVSPLECSRPGASTSMRSFILVLP